MINYKVGHYTHIHPDKLPISNVRTSSDPSYSSSRIILNGEMDKLKVRWHPDIYTTSFRLPQFLNNRIILQMYAHTAYIPPRSDSREFLGNSPSTDHKYPIYHKRSTLFNYSVVIINLAQ